MAFYSEEDLEKVRGAADIVQIIGEKIPLKRSGRNFKAACPFHTEKTPSFMVSAEKQIYHCFGCHEGGNVFRFLTKYEGLDFPEVVERLADRFGISLKKVSPHARGEAQNRRSEKEKLLKINQMAARLFYDNLRDPEKGKRVRKYLEERGVSEESSGQFFLGYASGKGRELTDLLRNKGVSLDKAESLGLVRKGDTGHYDFFRDRIVFAITSVDGKVIGFSGRSLGEDVQPKYLNSSESPIYNKSESFLGLNLAKQPIREKDLAILVEGNFDLVRLSQEGFRNVVAPLGTALTIKQIKLLCRFSTNFLFLFDADQAGEKAAFRGLEMTLPLGLFPKVVLLPKGEDPDSFLMKSGAAALQKRIESAPSLLDVQIDQILEREGGSAAGRGKAVQAVAHLISLIQGDVEKSLYIQRVAQRVGVPASVVAGEVSGKGKKPSNFSEEKGEEMQRLDVSPVEKTLLEILLSGRVKPGEIFQQIRGEDFSDSLFGETWNLLKLDFEKHRSIDVARLTNDDVSPPIRTLLTELAVGAERWKEVEDQVTLDLVRRFQLGRYKGILRGISQEIREAEQENDILKVQKLLERKNNILKEMATIH